MSKINLMVIFGGPSGEHEVSLSSAKGVLEHLDKGKYNIIPAAIDRQGKWLLGDQGNKYLIDNTQEKTIDEQLAREESQTLTEIANNNITGWQQGETGVDKIDLVMPVIHGNYGEDGKLQGMLDMLGLPYVFSGSLASALAMNKPKTKVIVKEIGVQVLPNILLNKNDEYDIDDLIKEIGLPVVVKPAELGSSVGISIPKTKEDLENSIQQAFAHDANIMLEKFQKGRELTCAVLGNNPPQALSVVEIVPVTSEFYDYKAKYDEGGSKHYCPADIPEDIKNKVQENAIKSFKAIGCSDLARADFIWDEETNEIYFLEINTIPGMTPTSLVPEEAKEDGYEFAKLLDKLIDEALKRYQN